MNTPTPTRITLLALQQGIMSTLVGPMDVFTYAGRAWNHLLEQPQEPCFSARIVSVGGKPITSLNGMSMNAHKAMDEVTQTDVVMVTSGGNDLDNVLEQRSKIIPWLQKHHRNGALITGVCSGTFLLAEAGLLDGLQATTHWGMAYTFAQRYSKVKLAAEALLVDEGKVLTAGGANAGSDLALHLVRRLKGERIATECARALLLEIHRQSQACFAPMLHHRHHGDTVMNQLQDWLEHNYQSPISIESLADKSHMSTRTLMRRFKQATGITPLAYLQKLRMSAARTALSDTDKTVEQVAHEVGYEDVVFFRRLFKRQYGLVPSVYRERFPQN